MFRDVVGTGIIFCAIVCSSIAGIGGGGLYVPLLVLLFPNAITTREAIGLSSTIALGSTLTNCYVHRDSKNEKTGKTIFNFAAIAYLEPMTIFGTVLGVYSNQLLSEKTLTVIAGIFLCLLSIRTLRNGFDKLKREKQQQLQQDTKQPELRPFEDTSSFHQSESPKNLTSEQQTHQNEDDKTIEEEQEDDEGDSFLYSIPSQPEDGDLLRARGNRRSSKIKQKTSVQILLLPTFAASLFVFLVSLGEKMHLEVLKPMVVVLVSFAVSFAGTKFVEKRLLVEHQEEEPWVNGAHFRRLALYSAMAGWCASFFGIGGGMVKSPMLIELLELEPKVVRLTSSFMILCTSSATVLQYYFLNLFPFQLSIALLLLGVCGGAVGNLLLKTSIGKYPSIIVIFIGGVMGFASMFSMISFMTNETT